MLPLIQGLWPKFAYDYLYLTSVVVSFMTYDNHKAGPHQSTRYIAYAIHSRTLYISTYTDVATSDASTPCGACLRWRLMPTEVVIFLRTLDP